MLYQLLLVEKLLKILYNKDRKYETKRNKKFSEENCIA